MNPIYRFGKRLMWPGPDYGTRVRHDLQNRFLSGPDVKTLDLGCGNGCMTLAAAKRGGTALGVSLDSASISRAEAFRNLIGFDENRCKFTEASVYDLKQMNLPKFDQIIAFEILEHLFRDEEVLKYCSDQLTEDGWIHITVPNRDNHVHFEGISRFETGAHVRHGYDYTALEAMLRKVGLEPVDRQGVGGLGTVMGFSAVAKARKLPGALGQISSVLIFFLAWPLVKILNLIPFKPWSLYVLGVKRGS